MNFVRKNWILPLSLIAWGVELMQENFPMQLHLDQVFEGKKNRDRKVMEVDISRMSA